MANKAENKDVEKKAQTPQEFLQETLDAMTHGQRLEWLDANAHAVTEEEYRAPLTPEELDEVKGRVTTLASRLQALEDKKKAFMDELNTELKPMKADFEIAVREARQEERLARGKVWTLPDADSKTTFRVAEGNVIIQSRPIRREELDGNLFGAGIRVVKRA